MNPQGTIKTTIPDIKSARRFPFRGISYFTNWNISWHDAGKSEDPVYNNIFKNAGRKKVLKLKKVNAKILIRFT